MKKFVLILVAIGAFSFSAQAQEIADNAIGLRLGGNDGFGPEINYQRALSENNRLEVGLGWRSNGDFTAFKLSGIYQWVWNIDGGFNWYAGPGAGIASVEYDEDFFPDDRFDNSETYIFLAGDIGVEYNFDIPLLLSLDFRPEIGFGDYNDDVDFDIALGVRYQF